MFYDEIKNHKHMNKIVSLMIRASYGGMQGDIFMMTSFADLWYERIAGITS
jgi:hypothetical protein